MKRIATILFITFAMMAPAQGQSEKKIVEDFKPACDSMALRMTERTTVSGILELKAVMKRKSSLDFYFTESFGDYPLYSGDIQWFKKEFKKYFPEDYSKYKIGEIYSRKVSAKSLVTPDLNFDGTPPAKAQRKKDPSRNGMIVTREGAMNFDKGLTGRHITMWQSHGRFYSTQSERWEWQRPALFQTCEDMFTQGFVLPFLAPMLENAGAYVMMPRERDIQKNEIIADNDSSCCARGRAEYVEKGRWKNAGSGFADLKPIYTDCENPFTTGTARQIECIASDRKTTSSSASWIPEIPERGEYAVYVSYKTLPNSTSSACYTVTHLGGTSRFIVNQKMGGGTWIYLGTFEFDKGTEGKVRLDNRTPEGYRHVGGSVVTADAVKFGGGMGNIARGENPVVSGLPRSAEAARYWLQWAGADSSLYYLNEGQNDNRDDFMSRGDWVEWISRGSRMNPARKDGLSIPVDLSLAFHTDAGVTPDSSTIGTLAIYTLKSEGKRKLPDKEDRMTSRQYADMVQSQIVNDLRACYDSLWNRRSIWDRSYRECRTPSSPSMILELLSHQNFADMKYGLDPSFRFAVSRAIYKGIVKYLSGRYGCPYAIQPLPASHMSVRFSGNGKALISWKETADTLEPTAAAKGFMLYTRVGEGAFNSGKVLDNVVKNGDLYSVEVPVAKDVVYSFRIAAYNDGGTSFPSETVSIGLSSDERSGHKVLVVNNFDRVSAPAVVDTPSYAGFDNSLDSGVPYINDITFIGEMYQFRRNMPWTGNESQGFGASYVDKAGEVVAGNTFDYASVHGKALLKAGYSFHSCSNEAFCTDSTIRDGAWAVDLICGKQVTVSPGSGMTEKYTVFNLPMQKALKAYTSSGGNLLISGAHIGTDVWDKVYDSSGTEGRDSIARSFVTNTLGYRWITNYASRQGVICSVENELVDMNIDSTYIYNVPNPESYSVETPDGLAPASDKAQTIFRYADSSISAGIGYIGNGYRTICLGFPVESLKSREDMEQIISKSLEFFEQ